MTVGFSFVSWLESMSNSLQIFYSRYINIISLCATLSYCFRKSQAENGISYHQGSL